MAKLMDKIGKETAEVSAEIVEASLDQLLDDGFVKDLPVVGTIAKLWGVRKKISEAVFLKKVLKFLHQLHDLTEEQKQEFYNSLKDEKEKQKLDETLIVYLDRYEDDSKASLLGNIFKAYILGNINRYVFFRLTWCIDRAFAEDLLEMKKGKQISNFVKESLAEVGFFKVTVGQKTGYRGEDENGRVLGMLGAEETRVTTEINLTELGKLFIHNNGL